MSAIVLFSNYATLTEVVRLLQYGNKFSLIMMISCRRIFMKIAVATTTKLRYNCVHFQSCQMLRTYCMVEGMRTGLSNNKSVVGGMGTTLVQ